MHPSNVARDRRRAEARILRQAREALLKEMDSESSKAQPDIDKLGVMTTKVRKLDASLARYEARENPKPKPPTLDGRTQAARLAKEQKKTIEDDRIRSLSMHAFFARLEARNRRGIDPDLPENAEVMKRHEAEMLARFKKMAAELAAEGKCPKYLVSYLAASA